MSGFVCESGSIQLKKLNNSGASRTNKKGACHSKLLSFIGLRLTYFCPSAGVAAAGMTFNSSMSNTRSEYGGIAPGLPAAPYALK